MSRTRVTVSLPKRVVEAADRRADDEARSRSWVVAEALAAYTGLPGSSATVSRPPDLGDLRVRQLRADLKLSPERRVLEAELTARMAELRECRGRRSFVVSFERYEDYLHWKDREAVGLS